MSAPFSTSSAKDDPNRATDEVSPVDTVSTARGSEWVRHLDSNSIAVSTCLSADPPATAGGTDCVQGPTAILCKARSKSLGTKGELGIDCSNSI